MTYFQTARDLNRRQARWALFLSRFDFSLTHQAGTQSGKPDALSRRSDHNRGENDNVSQTLLAPHLFSQVIAANPAQVPLEGLKTQLINRIKECEDRDESVVKALKELGTRHDLHEGEWSEEDGVVLHCGKVYVPLDPQLQHDIVKGHHNSPVTGHPGQWKTYKLISRNYWWPGLGRYVAKYVTSCNRCNWTKTFPAAPIGKLMPNRVPTARWQIVTTDLIVELPNSQGYNAILVVVDRLSKRAHFMATTNEVDSIGVARLF